MLAVVPVRGDLPSGAIEVVAEADGRVLLIGRDVEAAAAELAGVATEIKGWEAGPFAAGDWSQRLAPFLADEETLVLPASPDGRDLAPRLAHVLQRPLVASAFRVANGVASIARLGGRIEADVPLDEPSVVTFALGSRQVIRGSQPLPTVHMIDVPTIAYGGDGSAATTDDCAQLQELSADPTTMDLVEASRIVGGGAGLGSAEALDQIARFGAAIGASLGATRVVTDAGWTGHERQIGTTGVEVDPDLYLAFGISGAVQHVMGLGNPNRIISVNTDPSCPMMGLADVAVVSDARAVADELGKLIADRSRP